MVYIRESDTLDIPRILEIWLEASTLSHDFVPRDFWVQKLPAMRDIYIPDSYTLVAEVDGKVEGFLSLNQYTVAALFVSPEAQGKGLGKSLLQRAMLMKEHLTLTVYKSNRRAISFYTREGFSRLGEQSCQHTGFQQVTMVLRS